MPATVFLGAVGILLWVHANRLILSPDEGIMFEAAQRMLHGQKLYVDFFGYMSPGGYWLQELAFRIFGLSLRAGRVVMILDFAALCALTFHLVARYASPRAALVAVIAYFGLVASNPLNLLPGHRWDSAALSLLSVVLCIEGWWIAAGALAALAAFCTPSMAIFIPLTCAAMLGRSRRRFLAPYALAAAVTAIVLIVGMAWAGYFKAFFAQMLWLDRHYAAVNITPYGAFNGGYPGFRDAVAGVAWPLRPLLLLYAALPAVLPGVALGGWGIAFARKRMTRDRFPILYLLACMLAYVASTYPRPNVAHLTTIAPVGFVLTAVLLYRCLGPALRTAIALLMLPCAVMPAMEAAVTISAETRVPTPAGELRVARDAEPGVRRLLTLVRPGDTLYVHPYLPLFYFLTQTRNPTRFSYLAPGMMTETEELSVLGDLERSPPRWILYLPLTREAFLRVFPRGENLPHRFELIEAWLRENYGPVSEPLEVAGYQLLARRSVVDVHDLGGREAVKAGRRSIAVGADVLGID